MSLEDPDKAWLRIEEEIKNNGGKIKAPAKKTWTNPLQEKYQELCRKIRSLIYLQPQLNSPAYWRKWLR